MEKLLQRYLDEKRNFYFHTMESKLSKQRLDEIVEELHGCLSTDINYSGFTFTPLVKRSYRGSKEFYEKYPDFIKTSVRVSRPALNELDENQLQKMDGLKFSTSFDVKIVAEKSLVIDPSTGEIK